MVRLMSISPYCSVTLLSYSPLAGVRTVAATEMATLLDMDIRGGLYQDSTARLTAMTKQPDPALRMQFACWAIDRAPSEELRNLVPLEMFILHYARSLPAWVTLAKSPALNIVVLDWPDGTGGYSLRGYFVGSEGPMAAEHLPFFYEQQRELASPDVQALMPLIFN